MALIENSQKGKPVTNTYFEEMLKYIRKYINAVKTIDFYFIHMSLEKKKSQSRKILSSECECNEDSYTISRL